MIDTPRMACKPLDVAMSKKSQMRLEWENRRERAGPKLSNLPPVTYSSGTEMREQKGMRTAAKISFHVATPIWR